MTPTSRSWFYSSPGNDAYQIAERVRLTLWDARIGSVWLDMVNASEPYKMAGVHKENPIEIEWAPGEWFKLRVKPDTPALVDGFNFVLGLRPVFKYVDPEERTVWEWRISDAEDRWKEISGNPVYQQPERLV